MQKKYFHNSIISFILIVSTILMPLSFIPKKAEAQVGISGYASGLAPAIASLPQCKEVINSGIKSLFTGIGNILGDENLNDIASQAGEAGASSLDDVASSAASSFDNINVFDTEANKKLDALKKQSEAIKQSTESLNANSTCIQSIGRLIIKMLLQKLTISTVAWINSGFDGAPAFIQDPGKFFNDIAKNEILQFGLEINNPELFPFGRAWMQNTAVAFNNKFQDNAQYSLNKLIQDTTPEYSATTFQEDFSQGGWNAWTAMTQVPANNPLGFKLMADNEIQRRLAGTTQSVAQDVRDALQEANGFLGDQRCVDPEGLTKQQDSDAKLEGNKEGICKKWEYVTPGKLVSEAATNVMGYQNNAYLNVEDLNDAVAAILDALLSQFSSNIMEKGFANIGDQGIDGSLVYDTSSLGDDRTQTEKDFMPSQLTSSWLSTNRNFNIRTDLTQALIDEQRTYSDKLALQNKELLSTTDGKEYKLDTTTGQSNAYGLMPATYQLDYCIPGPHPGWEEDSLKTLNAVTNLIISETPESIDGRSGDAIKGVASTIGPLAGIAIGVSIASSGAILGLQLGSFAGPVGAVVGAIVGAIIGWIAGIFGGDSEEDLRLYYSTYVASFTGMLPAYDNNHDTTTGNISSKQGVVQGFNVLLDRYIKIMNKTYFSSPEILPAVTKEASVNFNQLRGYGQMIKNNEDKIALLKTTTNILGEIKDAVSELNQQYPDGGDEYENQLKAQINTFGRLSATMVNGDDIASADNLYKQIKDKKEYIYKNLLKGPYGCEAFLADPNNIKNFPSAGAGSLAGRDWNNYNVNSVKRMTYPFPILYDYNNFAANASLPDPWNGSLTPTRMPATNMYSEYGPGFLSFVFFSAGHETGLDHTEVRGTERLKFAEDVFGTGTAVEYRYTSVGNRTRSDNTSSAAHGGPFESIIGVY